MTTTATDDASLASALAVLWQRHRQTNLDRISLLETVAAGVLRSSVDDHDIAEGAGAAHKLAGSLGTFGFDAGTRAALEAECLLREREVDGQLLAEAVTALRSSVEQVGAPELDSSGRSKGNEAYFPPVLMAHLVSVDPELVSRLTAEAVSFGIAISDAGELPIGSRTGTGLAPILIIDDGPMGRWSRPLMLKAISVYSAVAPVIVLTTGVGFDERLELAEAGAAAVLPRALGARQVILHLSEAKANRTINESVILGMNIDFGTMVALDAAISSPEHRVDLRNDSSECWEVLEERGADLLLVGFEGSEASGPDLCRMLRAHPRWNRLPVIVVDRPGMMRASEAFGSGADDYLCTDSSPDEVRSRMLRHLEASGMTRDLCDTDRLTGTENRVAAERSLDLLLQTSSHRVEALTVALISIDGLEQVRVAEGNAMADVVVRRLGARLRAAFFGDDVVGRWSNDGFVVGICGVSCGESQVSILKVLEDFAAEEFNSTRGTATQFTFSAGLASYPVDGTTLNSLERMSETALRRALATGNSVVVAGERLPSSSASIVDVVLVEDDDSVADVIEHALNLRNYSYVRLIDGAEAASALGDGQIRANIVLLDIGLPSLDGFGVLQVLRARGVLGTTRVIMLTARSSESEMLRAQGLGSTDHITKPFSIPVLLGRLEQTRARDMP